MTAIPKRTAKLVDVFPTMTCHGLRRRTRQELAPLARCDSKVELRQDADPRVLFGYCAECGHLNTLHIRDRGAEVLRKRGVEIG